MKEHFIQDFSKKCNHRPIIYLHSSLKKKGGDRSHPPPQSSTSTRSSLLSLDLPSSFIITETKHQTFIDEHQDVPPLPTTHSFGLLAEMT